VTSVPTHEKSTPELIREAAMRLFAHRGYEATTLQAVAEVVGISKQAILHHFRSKEELHDAVLRQLIDHWNRTLPQLLVTASATKNRFDAVFSETVAFFRRDPDRARLVLRELLDRPEATRKLLGEVISPWFQAIAGYMRIGQERGVHRADLDPEAYLLMIFQLAMMGVATTDVMGAILGEGPSGHERFTRELARIAHAAAFTPRAST
jgi:AcrR family transcriptional regulator